MKQYLLRVLSALFFPLPGGDPLGGADFRRLPDSSAGKLLEEFARRTARGDEARETPADSTERFLDLGGRLLLDELVRLYESDEEARMALFEACEYLDSPGASSAGGAAGATWNEETRRVLWRLFFPEGAALESDREGGVLRVRKRREVRITAPNEEPINDPVRELLFTANVLITVPTDPDSQGVRQLPQSLRERVLETMKEPQLYHYDHPIHIGVPLEANEAVYGLRGLDRMIAFEKRRGTVESDAKATVVLSLSVTHEGLHTVAPDYLRGELARAGGFENLKVYLFTELECRTLAGTLFDGENAGGGVNRVFGVDGEYGRHYNFLKAIAAFWQAKVDPGVRGTFKIDLDQVFPQEVLVSESGESALEHFRTALWGARGVDAAGTPVELGMIAGALVNEKDIHKGLFTPDVTYPDEIPPGEAAVFYNRLPMALSTEAEMMTRYDGSRENPDGRRRCLQRYHVTGGTNGILIDALRRHRPFTPSFIGRAEDQCYILSRLYEGEGPYLRYLHKPGLIMRHDKEAFAGESIEAARHGRFVGDLVRTYYFSRYAEALPWGFDRVKEQIDPFTGCFATRRTWTVIMLRLAFHCAALMASGSRGPDEALTVLRLAAERLGPFAATEAGEKAGTQAGVENTRRSYLEERDAWDAFYDALDSDSSDPESLRRIVEGARVV
ncbi:MAG: hypothetical protein ACLFPV_11840 [Spirochaetaceae bacterium]